MGSKVDICSRFGADTANEERLRSPYPTHKRLHIMDQMGKGFQFVAWSSQAVAHSNKPSQHVCAEDEPDTSDFVAVLNRKQRLGKDFFFPTSGFVEEKTVKLCSKDVLSLQTGFIFIRYIFNSIQMFIYKRI